jgi:hypothetical protein
LTKVVEAVSKGVIDSVFELDNQKLNDKDMMKKIGFEEDEETEQLNFNIDGFDSEIDY